jgi:arylformamidase
MQKHSKILLKFSKVEKSLKKLLFTHASTILFIDYGGNMHIYDISLPITPGMPVWPGDPSVVLERVKKIEEGANSNVTHLSLSAHTGTHVDAPYHFLGGDSPTIDRLPLKLLTGRAYVLHLPGVDLITASVLERAEIPPRTRRLLLKTRNSDYWLKPELPFQTDFVAISPDGAQHLVERGVKLVGIDYLSIAPYGESRPTHQVLLKAGTVLLEGLDLSKVSQGRYTLHCLPLKLVGSDGAPARAILIGV